MQRTPEEQELFTQLGNILQGCLDGDLTLTPVLIDGIERRCRELMQSNPEHIEVARRVHGMASGESVMAWARSGDTMDSSPWHQLADRMRELTGGMEPL